MALTLLPQLADAQWEVLAQCRCADGTLTPIHCDEATRIPAAQTRAVNGNWYESPVCNEWCADRGGIDYGGWKGLVRSAIAEWGFRSCDMPLVGQPQKTGPAFDCICMDSQVHRGCAQTQDWNEMHMVCAGICAPLGQLHDHVSPRQNDTCDQLPQQLPSRADACHCDTNPPSATVWCISSEGFATDAELSAACADFCQAEFGVGVHHSEPDSTRCLWLPPDPPPLPQTTTTTEPIVTTTTVAENGCDNDLPGILDDLRCLVGLLP